MFDVNWHGQAHVVEEGLETEAATGARVGQVEQEARAEQAEQEATRVEQALE